MRSCGMGLDRSTVRRVCVLVRAGRSVKVSVPHCNSELWHFCKRALISQIRAGVSASGPWAAGKRGVRQGLEHLAAAPAHDLSHTAITAREQAYTLPGGAQVCLPGARRQLGSAGCGRAWSCHWPPQQHRPSQQQLQRQAGESALCLLMLRWLQRCASGTRTWLSNAVVSCLPLPVRAYARVK